jgi:hypothetical protein
MISSPVLVLLPRSDAGKIECEVRSGRYFQTLNILARGATDLLKAGQALKLAWEPAMASWCPRLVLEREYYLIQG